MLTLVRRDDLSKIRLPLEEVSNKIKEILPIMQQDMYDKALKRRDSMIYEANNYEEFKTIATTKPGFIKANWCGEEACENKIKDDFSMKSRCLIEDEPINTPCLCCGKPAKYRLYFGKQY